MDIDDIGGRVARTRARDRTQTHHERRVVTRGDVKGAIGRPRARVVADDDRTRGDAESQERTDELSEIARRPAPGRVGASESEVQHAQPVGGHDEADAYDGTRPRLRPRGRGPATSTHPSTNHSRDASA